MISISKAIETIKNNLPPLKSELISVSQSLGSALSQDVLSPISLPLFDNSAMDGYAICYGPKSNYELVGEIKAGDDATLFNLKENQAIRIFTGAMVPNNTTHIVRQEDVTSNIKEVQFSILPKLGGNIRKKGTEINKGEIILQEGTLINPATVGLLKSLGMNDIHIFKHPKIAIVSTGNELRPSGVSLQPGQIFESNSSMLQQAIREVEQIDSTIFHCPDDQQQTEDLIARLISTFDILIFTGGISVGDYDFVGSSLKHNEVKELFYKVEQKPGKPLWFGSKNNTLCFAIPGNPAAALTCFYIYIKPVLSYLKGKGFEELKQIEVPLQAAIEKPNGRPQFLKAKLKNGTAEILDRQSSSMLKSFSESNAIGYLPANETREKGDSILIYQLP